MVNMSGVQLRQFLKVKFINEEGIDARGPLAKFITLLGQAFAEVDTMFENFGEAGVVISLEAVALSHQLQPIFRFFGRFLILAWILEQPVPIQLSLPLLRQIKGEQVDYPDIQLGDPQLIQKLDYFMTISEEDWDMHSDTWRQEIRKVNDSRREQQVQLLPGGQGKGLESCRYL